MIYAMVDLTGDRIVDVLVTSGNAASSAERKESQFREMAAMYAKLAGKKRDFSSASQAREAIAKIMHQRCFPDKEKSEKKEADRPVATVRRICAEMKGFPRKDIIEACARQGVKRSTAAVQYQKFRTLQGKAKGSAKPQASATTH